VDFLTGEEQLSNRKACKLIGISRTTYQYKRKPKDDQEVQQALTTLTQKHPSTLATGSAATGSGIKARGGILNAYTGCAAR
jgi:hypothetical protein